MDASAYLYRFVCLSLFYGQLVLFIIKQIRIQPFCYATLNKFKHRGLSATMFYYFGLRSSLFFFQGCWGDNLHVSAIQFEYWQDFLHMQHFQSENGGNLWRLPFKSWVKSEQYSGFFQPYSFEFNICNLQRCDNSVFAPSYKFVWLYGHLNYIKLTRTIST